MFRRAEVFLVQPHRKARVDGGENRKPDHIQRRGEPRQRPGRRERGHAHLTSDEEEGERILMAIQNPNTI